MTFKKSLTYNLIATLALVVSFSAVSLAKTNTNSSFSNIKIKNFGQMDERFYRGARPKDSDYEGLKALGINTIIDLTDNSREYEQPAVESHGLRYVNIPMVDKSYPSTAQIDAFMKVVNDPATGKFFVHCAGGRHRTGIVGAVYRFTHDHWNYDQVLAEMNRFEFGSGMGHGKQKSFVEDYWKQIQSNQASTASVAH